MSDFLANVAGFIASPFRESPPEDGAPLLGAAPPRSADGWDLDDAAPGDITNDSVDEAEYQPAAMYTQTPAGTQLTPQFSGVPTTLQPDVPGADLTAQDFYGQRDESLAETGFGQQQSQPAEFGGARRRSGSPSTSSFGGVGGRTRQI